ncbi:MAG: hypothetical protein FWE20_12335 [Defluviitaleaceae bacterium]|nr:hypothetical protein [Defluviitaleaceae bacterium]
MGQNVTISLTLLKNLVALLESWDCSLFDRAIRDDYWDALCALKIKLLKLDLRDAYSMIVGASSEDARHTARIEYLRLKSQFQATIEGSNLS